MHTQAQINNTAHTHTHIYTQHTHTSCGRRLLVSGGGVVGPFLRVCVCVCGEAASLSVRLSVRASVIVS